MMDIRTCLEILELDHPPTQEEAKQAYKDLVNVWHPDRFSGNPRLRERAEKKLKEINIAYETLLARLESGSTQNLGSQEEGTPHEKGPEAARQNQDSNQSSRTTEAVFENGTFFVLNAWSRLSGAVRGFVTEMKKAASEKDTYRSPGAQENFRGQGRAESRGYGRGRGMAGGRGMGKGRGQGRGGGRGRRR